MQSTDTPFLVTNMSNDPRVRVFRRIFAPNTADQMEVDAFIVITTRYVIVLDTLLCPEDMETVMHEVREELAGREVLVVNSHADWDHCWGNNYFTGENAASIVAHDHCFTRLKSEKEKAELLEYQKRYPYFQNVVLIPPTITFLDKLTIHGGDLTLELFSAPGHHADHIAVWIPEIEMLLAFDAAEKPLPLIENAESVQHMYDTLEHFVALQPQCVLCAHGKTTDISIVTQNLHYLREIEQRGRTLLAAHSPSNTELEHPSTLIRYSFDDVVAPSSDISEADRAFYTWAHERNVHYVLQWLQQKG